MTQVVTRSVESEVTVYFNFGFSGLNMDSSNISQFALTDLISHLKNSVTACAFNEEENTLTFGQLTISKLEIVHIIFVNQHHTSSKNFNFKITLKLFHKSSSVTSSAFEDIDKITTKMFQKISKKKIEPEFEPFPCFIKSDFHAKCTHQHVCGFISLHG